MNGKKIQSLCVHCKAIIQHYAPHTRRRLLSSYFFFHFASAIAWNQSRIYGFNGICSSALLSASHRNKEVYSKEQDAKKTNEVKKKANKIEKVSYN